jgi:hypothetical protein
VAQLGARLDGIEEVVGSNPIGSTNFFFSFQSDSENFKGLSFAKTLADFEINHIAALSVGFCYNFWPCFDSPDFVSECCFGSWAPVEVSFSRI